MESRQEGSHWISLQMSASPDCAGRVSLHDKTFQRRSKPVPRRIIFHDESVVFWCPKIIGSVNGVVCLYTPNKMSSSWDGDHPVAMSTSNSGSSSFLSIFNPSIQKSRRVDIPWEFPPYRRKMMGFGYANSSRDYKFVMITKDTHEGNHIHLYSLQTNRWIESHSKSSAAWTWNNDSDLGTYFDGACYWVPKVAGIRKLVCFNLNDEKLQCMKLPQTTSPTWCLLEMSSYSDDDDDDDDDIQTLVHKDMLCVCLTCRHITGSITIQIWGMKEVGNQNSWTSLLHVCMKDDGPKKWLDFSPRLLEIDARGSLLFHNNTILSSYNPQSKQWTLLKKFHPNTCHLVSYKESLALIDVDDASTGPRQARGPARQMHCPSIFWPFAFTCLFLEGILLFPFIRSSLW